LSPGGNTAAALGAMAFYTIYRVTTCLENLEISGNLTAVSEMSGKKSCQEKVA